MAAQQEGLEDTLLDYCDIMVIGKTGAGKSTTADKLLIAHVSTELPQPGQQPRPCPQPEQPPQPQSQQQQQTEQFGHMTMWRVSSEEIGGVILRLKKLTLFESYLDPYKAINNAYADNIYGITRDCALFSNEQTKVRVLDVPGFFGNVARNVPDLNNRVMAVKENDLRTMRKILRIKSAHNFKFNRIVYFLPEKGSLKRASQELIIELGVMKEYFGRPIFESMVIVATYPSDVYKFLRDDGQDLFSEKEVEDTREYLREALREVFKSDDIPDPPIIFISLFDSCEEILRKVKTANVTQDAVNLEFTESVCARCDKNVIKEGEGEGVPVACSIPGQQGRIPLDESTCHPLMIPKYSRLTRFLGGIARIVTFGHFVMFMDEVCIRCKEPPATHGCAKIGSVLKFGEDTIIVQHSNVADCNIVVGEDRED